MTDASAHDSSLRSTLARNAPVLLPLGLAVAVVASLGVGAYPMSFPRSLDVLFHLLWPFSWPPQPAFDLREITIVEVIRPPRILVATFAGVALGLAGAALQGMMRNPLVGPDLVGVSSGAAFGGVLAMLLDFPPMGLIGGAFCGGLVAMALTLALARLVDERSDSVSMVLAGFFVGAFFLACVGLIEFMEQDRKLPLVVYWLLGSFRGADPQKVWMIGLPTLACGATLMALRWRINLLSLGELDAASLGVDVKKLRWAVIALVSLIVAAQVAVCGVVAWVGLVTPHCARMLVGPDHRRLLPASAILGGLFTLGLDDLTRTLVRAEIPVGVLTAFFGTPIVCFLFWKTQSKGWIND
ncbi:putative+ABC+transporter+permease+protein [Methylocapsa aurea]|uniref:FecCD family ABC transporter permease n=1 Tax=Methylocapsa aurea TaxID=663610 RepID=UPI003D18E391